MMKWLAIIIVSFAGVCAAANEPNAFALNKLLGRGINISGVLYTPRQHGKCDSLIFNIIGV
jgi:hypothetical protein